MNERNYNLLFISNRTSDKRIFFIPREGVIRLSKITLYFAIIYNIKRASKLEHIGGCLKE